MSNTIVSGIILEGIAGTGKTTLLRTLLSSDAWSVKPHMSIGSIEIGR
jgi:guanylate kinase